MKRLLTVVVASLFSLSVFAADPPNTESIEIQNSMDKTVSTELMKHMGPVEAHKNLNPMVGNFKYTLKYWMAPNSKPEESKGTSKGKWILGGRFVQQDVKGKSMGKEFLGTSTMGYDSMREQYQTSWIDNMSNHMMIGTGTFDTSSKTFTESGDFSCVMTNDKNRTYRTEIKIGDKSTYTYSMFLKDKEGKEFKSMEINYTRL